MVMQTSEFSIGNGLASPPVPIPAGSNGIPRPGTPSPMPGARTGTPYVPGTNAAGSPGAGPGRQTYGGVQQYQQQPDNQGNPNFYHSNGMGAQGDQQRWASMANMAGPMGDWARSMLAQSGAGGDMINRAQSGSASNSFYEPAQQSGMAMLANGQTPQQVFDGLNSSVLVGGAGAASLDWLNGMAQFMKGSGVPMTGSSGTFGQTPGSYAGAPQPGPQYNQQAGGQNPGGAPVTSDPNRTPQFPVTSDPQRPQQQGGASAGGAPGTWGADNSWMNYGDWGNAGGQYQNKAWSSGSFQ